MVTSTHPPAELTAAMETVLEGYGVTALRTAVAALIARYHDPDESSMVRTTLDAAAYVAYRMPATHAVASQVVGEYTRTDPDFMPRSLVDVGGGTGAAAWAAASQWPSLRDIRVIDGSAPMRELGRSLATGSSQAAVRNATWEPAGDALPYADVITASYVLGELTTADRPRLLQAMGRADVAIIVEPGTPAGYQRTLAARSLFIDAGMRIAAPCPHDLPCPLVDDWCHFATRVHRTSLHRQIKGASLGHEDEKYSYVVATRRATTPAAQRILRHPRQRKGLVELILCVNPPGTDRRVVTRRDGATFRRAKDAHWGDPWS